MERQISFYIHQYWHCQTAGDGGGDEGGGGDGGGGGGDGGGGGGGGGGPYEKNDKNQDKV